MTDSSQQAITSLSLTAFRNYQSARIDAGTQSVVLTGHNGAGKTNILEAISLLSPGRGLRKATLGTLTTMHSTFPGWVISAEANGRLGPLQVGTAKDTESEANKRIIKIDGERVRAQHTLTEHLSIIWQTPQMDGLFIDSGSVRRRFLDRLVYNVDMHHAARVSAYEHAMRERNKLLQHYSYDAQWVDVLEQRMAEQSVAIAAARNDMIDRINDAIEQASTSFPKANLCIEGKAEALLRDGMAAVDVEETIIQTLYAARMKDGKAGRTTYGVHRSELKVFHITKQMDAAYCSTGEQKALLLSILLAHARARKQWQGAAPILLLDEVVAHLDEKRRAELFTEIADLGAQAWLTGTDAADFSACHGDALRFIVKNSEITMA